ncbi:unnamed protein product [Clonostachys rosea f. rosea IK726]|uniref:AB hydrolase-1 domain-containing protein n=2 Tax=Bionectria ochroleuca TaxID=29856 RepID=A0A0B7KJ36_BIOOC|nr:unnamed protein product [Clonostachys rosea f. rosea IK726]
MVLQVLDALKINEVYALGTSQGVGLSFERHCSLQRGFSTSYHWAHPWILSRLPPARKDAGTPRRCSRDSSILGPALCPTPTFELLSRLSEIKCPVYCLQGPEDPVFGKFIPAEHIKLFTSSPDAKLTFVEEAGHYLNATSPKETEEAILKMVQKHPQQYKLGSGAKGVPRGLHLDLLRDQCADGAPGCTMGVVYRR